jgi:hypothetical protein
MKRPITVFLILTFLFLSFSFDISAYPRFAAMTGDKCMDCHVNPTGGGMRNNYGIEGAKRFLNMEMFKKIAAKTEFSPKINDFISIGSDVRIVQVDNQIPGSSNLNAFMTMQGDLYVNARLNEIVSVMVTSGIQIPGLPVKYEVYGMLERLPLRSYFKAGRFIPNYGIKIVEHRSFQREFLLGTPYAADGGFEIGISPDFFNFNMGLFNGLNTFFFDGDANKMFVTSADFTFSFDEEQYNFNFGGSFYNNPYQKFDLGTSTFVNANRKAWGGFTKIGLARRVSILGELDFDEASDAITPLRRGMLGFGELNVRIIQGLELRGQYEFRDPDRNIADDTFSRISAGIAAFPFFGFETEGMIRFNKDHPVYQNGHEWQWSFHFYF